MRDEIPDDRNRTIPGDNEPSSSKLGFACIYPNAPSMQGPVAYHGNRLLTSQAVVPHGGLVEFHCSVQRYHKLSGPSTIECLDGAFQGSIPICERALFGESAKCFRRAMIPHKHSF